LSVLTTPTAGVTYGTNPIWVWHEETGDAPGHGNIRDVPPWREALRTEGIEGMSVLRSILGQVEWWRLRPAQGILGQQPGETDPRHWVAVAATDSGNLVVAYMPAGGEVVLSGDLPQGAVWRDPRNGATAPATGVDGRFTAPDERDWVLMLTE
ncbi:MAG: DUF4038 domain-containing protein, partial [Armatimonadia bacterium]|nr:DUF4038 domain-containing protein [Armatimonadia bacterium]